MGDERSRDGGTAQQGQQEHHSKVNRNSTARSTGTAQQVPTGQDHVTRDGAVPEEGDGVTSVTLKLFENGGRYVGPPRGHQVNVTEEMDSSHWDRGKLDPVSESVPRSKNNGEGVKGTYAQAVSCYVRTSSYDEQTGAST
ncbi:hypothetical protein Bbelb_007740 [Branchiostoma belcheri]|nr:hypothetical protein Bbelb_007740 [Branchiostoma belcheri]